MNGLYRFTSISHLSFPFSCATWGRAGGVRRRYRRRASATVGVPPPRYPPPFPRWRGAFPRPLRLPAVTLAMPRVRSPVLLQRCGTPATLWRRPRLLVMPTNSSTISLSSTPFPDALDFHLEPQLDLVASAIPCTALVLGPWWCGLGALLLPELPMASRTVLR
jgi:hypothetical protein